MTPDPQTMLDLFVHRTDVFSEQHSDGSYTPVRRPITDDDVAEHLAGFASYGTYVVQPGKQSPESTSTASPLDFHTVKYICWDLDIKDDKAIGTLAGLVQDAVENIAAGPAEAEEALLMEFSGNKGYHIWLLFDEPVPAYQARAFAEESVMRQWRPIAEASGWPMDVEVFPKQDSVDEGGYGNLVKLPFGFHAVTGVRSEAVPYQGWCLDVDSVVPLDVSLLPTVSPPTTSSSVRARSGDTSSGPHSPFPCVDQIMHHGAGRGQRDNAMFHLALYLYGHGIDLDLAETICLRANEHFTPPMRDSEVKHKVRSAYRGRYESARCGVGWLADLCPGPCKSGWSVAKSEASGGSLGRAQEGTTVEVNVVAVDRSRGVVQIGHPDADNTPALRVKGIRERN